MSFGAQSAQQHPGGIPVTGRITRFIPVRALLPVRPHTEGGSGPPARGLLRPVFLQPRFCCDLVVKFSGGCLFFDHFSPFFLLLQPFSFSSPPFFSYLLANALLRKPGGGTCLFLINFPRDFHTCQQHVVYFQREKLCVKG